MKCPNCNKVGAYIKFKTNEVVCRYCGYVGPRPKVNDDNVDEEMVVDEEANKNE